IVFWRAKAEAVPHMPRATWKELRTALRKGVWALLAPVFILGGIYGGIFTPTEAAAFACFYSFIVGIFIERELRISQVPAIILRAMKVSAIVMAIVSVSGGMGVLIAQEQLASKLAIALGQFVHEQWLILLILNAVFFLLAAIMDEVALMLIFGPMLIAIGNQFNIDPIHFGAMIATNVAIGMATPPIGYCLFVGSAIGGQSLIQLSRTIWPMILMMVLVLM